MNGTARTAVTGDLAVVADQAADLIDDQIRSMFLAAIIIAVVMILQMESVLVGLISLNPKYPASCGRLRDNGLVWNFPGQHNCFRRDRGHWPCGR